MVIYVLTAGALFDALTRVTVSVFTAFERSELTGVALVAQRFLQAALGIGALAAGSGVGAGSIAYAAAAAPRFVLSVGLLPPRLEGADAEVGSRRGGAGGVGSVP